MPSGNACLKLVRHVTTLGPQGSSSSLRFSQSLRASERSGSDEWLSSRGGEVPSARSAGGRGQSGARKGGGDRVGGTRRGGVGSGAGAGQGRSGVRGRGGTRNGGGDKAGRSRGRGRGKGGAEYGGGDRAGQGAACSTGGLFRCSAALPVS